MEITTHILVPDMDATLTFFMDLELFDVKDVSLGDYRRGTVSIKGDASLAFTIELSEPSTEAEQRLVGNQVLLNKCLLYFSIPGFKEWHRKMVSKSVDISPIKDFPWGASAIVMCPSGNAYAFSDGIASTNA